MYDAGVFEGAWKSSSRLLLRVSLGRARHEKRTAKSRLVAPARLRGLCTLSLSLGPMLPFLFCGEGIHELRAAHMAVF
jgi:hypothetical protein